MMKRIGALLMALALTAVLAACSTMSPADRSYLDEQVQKAEAAAMQAQTAADQAKGSAMSAEKDANRANGAANRAETAADTAEKAAMTATKAFEMGMHK